MPWKTVDTFPEGVRLTCGDCGAEMEPPPDRRRMLHECPSGLTYELTAPVGKVWVDPPVTAFLKRLRDRLWELLTD